jgi:hypothetical protein
MRPRFIIIITLVLGLGVTGYHVWRISQEEADLAALHESLGPCAIGSKPSWQLPMAILEPINRWIHGDITLAPPLPPPPPPLSLMRTARDAVHTAAYRLCSFVQGYCDGLFIYGAVSLEESFESNLARFQGLRSISLTLPDESPRNRATIERFCTAVHALPKLDHEVAANHERLSATDRLSCCHLGIEKPSWTHYPLSSSSIQHPASSNLHPPCAAYVPGSSLL